MDHNMPSTGRAAVPGGSRQAGENEVVFTPLAAHDPREAGGYLLRARIGEGGMGSVYLSYTPGGRPLAVKIARPEFATDPGFRRRFEKETAIAARVQGPYTAPVIDCDAHAPRPWLATAYIPAPSLAVTVARQGGLPTDTVLVLVAGIAEALQSIHSAGIIHRDLKPGNVILAVDGPRVIDFGISRAVESSSAALTTTGSRIGTPAFMAPEQVRGKSLDPAADVFALGAVAYYAATGELPFGGDAAVFYRIVGEEPDWEPVPERLRAVLRCCMRKDPAERPDPAELIELCRRATDDERLRIGEGWLPPTVTAEVTRYAAAQVPPTAPPPAAATPPAPTLPARVPPRRRTWRRGVLAGVAVGVLAASAGIGLYLAVAPGNNGDGSDGSPYVAATSTGTATSPSATRSPATTSSGVQASASPTALPDVVRWQGTVGLGAGETVDTVPPQKDEAGGSRIYDGHFSSEADSTISLWPGTGIPSRAQCDERVHTHPASGNSVVAFAPARKGEYICMITSQGYSARFHLLTVASSGYDGEAEVTVWDKNS